MTRALALGRDADPANPFHADTVVGLDARRPGPIAHADDRFDYVTSDGTIEQATPEVLADWMREVLRILRPGGLFLSETHVDRPHSDLQQAGGFTRRLHEQHGQRQLCVLQKSLPPQPAPSHARITVMIPVHNGERYIGRTLASALAQTYPDVEVLCVDDASTDGSAAILRAHAARDARVRLVTTPHNLGSAPRALNHALPFMTGAYFVYASQDDLFSPDWLEEMHARAVETSAEAVIPEVVLFHEDAASKSRSLVGVHGNVARVINGRLACELSLSWDIPGNALWDARLVRQLGFEEFAVNGDEYSVRRFFLACNKVAFSGGKFFYRQDNPNAVTKRFNAASFDWPYTQLRVVQLLQEHGFDAALVQKELDGAVSAMAALKTKLNAGPSSWSETEVARARAAIDRFEHHLALERVFGGSPRRVSVFTKRTAKWKNSLRKLYKRIGARAEKA